VDEVVATLLRCNMQWGLPAVVLSVQIDAAIN
jgi:hypothetical protein